jgi:hypothetical protein
MSDDVKDSFYKQLGHVFDQFPRYYMKILLGDINVKVGREDTTLRIFMVVSMQMAVFWVVATLEDSHFQAGKIFSNEKLHTRVRMKSVMTVELE